MSAGQNRQKRQRNWTWVLPTKASTINSRPVTGTASIMSRTEDERNCREKKLLKKTLELQGFRADEQEISRVEEGPTIPLVI